VTHDSKGQATALVVGLDNKVQLRTLRLSGTRGDQWIVDGGLEDGDRVIVGGLQKVQPGATVVASEAPATPPAAAASAASAADARAPAASASGTSATAASLAAAPKAAPASGAVADAKRAREWPTPAQTK
jgi:membrane fusion protein (multidrug efflux system)